MVCSPFAMVFLRANHVGATVLHMPLSNHIISFNINLSLMSNGPKYPNFIVENLYSSLNCINHP